MEREMVDSLLEWLILRKFDPSPAHVPDYLPEPLLIPGFSSLAQFIRFQKAEFAPNATDGNCFTKLINFQRALMTDSNLNILSILESVVTSVEYNLVYYKIKTFGSHLLDRFNANSNEKSTTMQILLNPKQSILEILETLLLPNVGIIDNFEFIVPLRCHPDIYLALWLVYEAIKVSGLFGFTIKLMEETSQLPNLTSMRSVTYPPTLAIVLDDADVFASVDRIVDLLTCLPHVNRKVDIWVQQSIKKKFTDKFIIKIGKLQSLQKLSSIIETDAINPVLSPSADPLGDCIKILTFRKIDELLSIVKRYQTIREISVWTTNVSCSFELTKGITNCHLFTINTINDFYLSGHYNYLHHSNVPYQLLGLETTFSSFLEIKSFLSTLKDFELNKVLESGMKKISSISIEARFSTIISVLSASQSINSNPINMVSLAKIGQATFQHINKCIMLRQFTPVGIVFIHLRPDDFTKSHQGYIIGLLSCVLLYGNCLVIVSSPDLPEAITSQINLLKSTFPSSVVTTSPKEESIPSGWLYKNSELFGISFDSQSLCDSFNFNNSTSIFGVCRSILFPIADQLSIDATPSSVY